MELEQDFLKCSTCKKMLPKSFFHKAGTRPRGYMYSCKACRKAAMESNAKKARTYSVGLKECVHCKESKPLTAFYKSKSSKDWLQSWCMECTNNYNRKHSRKSKRVFTPRAKENKSPVKYLECPHCSKTMLIVGM